MAIGGLCCVAPSPAQPVPLTPALWSDSPEPSASLIGSQSRVNQRSVSAGSISRNRCSSHHFRPPGMEPPARAATCVCCLSFPCAAAIALLLTSAPLHAGRCCTRCWNPALVARQMPSHHRQRRKARHKASVQTGPQPCAQMLARQVGDSTQRRFASPLNHSRGPRAGSAGGAHIGRPHSTRCATVALAENDPLGERLLVVQNSVFDVFGASKTRFVQNTVCSHVHNCACLNCSDHHRCV